MFRNITANISSWIFDKPLYRLSLHAIPAKFINAPPPYLWPGQAERGNALIENGFPGLSGTNELARKTSDFDPTILPETSLIKFHQFDWLPDLAATNQDKALNIARSWTMLWFRHYQKWDNTGWKPEIIGHRLCQWFLYLPWLAPDPESDLHKLILAELPRQAKHLARSAPGYHEGLGQFQAIAGLVYTGLLLPGRADLLEKGYKLLKLELSRQIYADGGHFHGNPSTHLAVLALLISLRHVASSHHQALSEDLLKHLQGAIDRMAPMLRAYLHGDGKLALFNGSLEEGLYPTNWVLDESASTSRPHDSYPHTGFHRLSSGRAVVLAEGRLNRNIASTPIYKGPLAIEFSYASHRIVVNCGAVTHISSAHETLWQQALCRTPAHSTLTVNDTDAAIQQRPFDPKSSFDRHEQDNSVLLDLRHEGYLTAFGLTHHRSLFLSSDGNDFRGEDTLAGNAELTLPFAIRFHLHPKIQASLAGGGTTVHLRLANGGGWRFHATGCTLSLEDSVYFGDGTQRRTQQIVAFGTHKSDKTLVNWRFSRETP